MKFYDLAYQLPCCEIVPDATKRGGRRWCGKNAVIAIVDEKMQKGIMTEAQVRLLCEGHVKQLANVLGLIICKPCADYLMSHYIPQANALTCPTCGVLHCGEVADESNECESCSNKKSWEKGKTS